MKLWYRRNGTQQEGGNGGRGMIRNVTEVDVSDRGSQKNETRFPSYVQNKFPKALSFSRL
jgi:hypothetical protein